MQSRRLVKTKVPLSTAGFQPQELLDRVGKGKPIPAIVEQIGNGSTLRVTILEEHQFASVQVCLTQSQSLLASPSF